MIKYQLVCEQKHEFEGWFQNSDAFASQCESGLVSCPLCDTTAVRRALMAPNIASPKTRKSIPAAPTGPSPGVPSSGATTPMSSGMPPEAARKMQALVTEMRALQAKIKAECRDVGAGFAEEARKIHYGEVEPEGIYGEVTADEREQLDEEGIEVFQMPWLPQDN